MGRGILFGGTRLKRIFIDTEFVEDGKTIDLISIALVDDLGGELYLVSSEYDRAKAESHAFVSQYVLPKVDKALAEGKAILF
jgi:hypothetical protein